MEAAKGKGVSLVVIIDRRGRAEQTGGILSESGVVMNLSTIGHGTADAKWIDILGLGGAERDVHISAVASDRAPALLERLRRELAFDEAGTGIAFTIPVSSVGGPKTLAILSGKAREEETA